MTYVLTKSTQPADATKGKAFDALLFHIRRDHGFDCSRYKESFFRRRLAVRMRQRGLGAYPDYLAVLRSDPVELDALLETLSINLSYFFRDESVFNALRDAVLAPLLAERTRAGQRRLTVWDVELAAAPYLGQLGKHPLRAGCRLAGPSPIAA